MKDFLKIFFVLCAVVAAFFTGRNYGEMTTNESSEIKSLKSDNYNNQNAQSELKNLKDKFQKLLDSSDLKKADEVLGKIMTVFLADLSLQLSDEQQKDIEYAKKVCSATSAPTTTAVKKEEPKEESKPIAPEEKTSSVVKNEKSTAKFKAAEFEMGEAQDVESLRRALNKLELKKIDSLLDGAPASTFQQSRKLFGTYRGSIMDVTGKVYATLVIDIHNVPENTSPISGSIKIFKNGKETSNNSFDTSHLGYAPESSSAMVLSIGATDYLQVYKSESLQKIAGIYYERLPNGTTKTIGTFILSRTDFIE